jgi:antitoxin component of MazEF toxin-antitoxin module
MSEDIKFPARISKMGDNKIIWIPKIMHDMIEEFEDERVTVTITRRNTTTTIVKGEMK